jgi:hypothetical protein
MLLFLATRAGAGVTEMDFNSGDMVFKMRQVVMNQTFDQVCERFTTFDAVVCTDFNVHAGYLLKIPLKWKELLGPKSYSILDGDVANCSGSSIFQKALTKTGATTIKIHHRRRVVIHNADIYTDAVVVNTAFKSRRSRYDIGVGCNDDWDAAGRIMAPCLRRRGWRVLRSAPAPRG